MPRKTSPTRRSAPGELDPVPGDPPLQTCNDTPNLAEGISPSKGRPSLPVSIARPLADSTMARTLECIPQSPPSTASHPGPQLRNDSRIWSTQEKIPEVFAIRPFVAQIASWVTVIGARLGVTGEKGKPRWAASWNRKARGASPTSFPFSARERTQTCHFGSRKRRFEASKSRERSQPGSPTPGNRANEATMVRVV